MRTIYADHAASAPLEPEVRAVMEQWMDRPRGNPSSAHSVGAAARGAVEDARRRIAGCIGCGSHEIIFTSGGTEADNLAITGVMLSGDRKHMITSCIEHPAVLRTCAALERQGVRVSYAPVDDSGIVDAEWIASAVTEQTGLIAVMAANNETGAIQPLARISAIARQHGIPFFTDAVQGAFYMPLWEHADLMSISAHKLGGPEGIGALVVRQGVRLSPIILGGGQERGYRSGTENAMGIVAMAAAVELAAARRQDLARVTRLREQLLEELVKIPHCRINANHKDTLPGIVSVCFDYVNGRDLVELLSRRGICVSSSSACAAGSMEPSHVLRAMGISPRLAAGALRISFGDGYTPEEWAYLAQQVRAAVNQLRNQDPIYVMKYGRS